MTHLFLLAQLKQTEKKCRRWVCVLPKEPRVSFPSLENRHRVELEHNSSCPRSWSLVSIHPPDRIFGSTEIADNIMHRIRLMLMKKIGNWHVLWKHTSTFSNEFQETRVNKLYGSIPRSQTSAPELKSNIFDTRTHKTNKIKMSTSHANLCNVHDSTVNFVGAWIRYHFVINY